MDRGGEYRSLIGLPGGMSHSMYPAVEAAANAKGMKLELGKGNDPDTLGKKMVYVYDTKDFPFYQVRIVYFNHCMYIYMCIQLFILQCFFWGGGILMLLGGGLSSIS